MLKSNTVMAPPLKQDIAKVEYKGQTLKAELNSLWYMFLRRVYSWINSATPEINSKHYSNISGGTGGWDDLRFPATAVDPVGNIGPPSYDETNVGYIFSGTQNNRLDMIVQLPHSWNRGNIHPHVHFRCLTNTNGNVVWQLKHAWANSLGQQPAWTSTNTNVVISNAVGNLVLKEFIQQLANIAPPTSAIESSVCKFQLLRLGTETADTLNQPILYDEFDVHYYNEKAGTDPEYPHPM